MFPQYSDIESPLLAELYTRGGSARPSTRNADGLNVYEVLARHFKLSHADLEETIYEKTGAPRSKWENMVRWVRNDLKKKGMLVMPSHGVWALSPQARSIIENKIGLNQAHT